MEKKYQREVNSETEKKRAICFIRLDLINIAIKYHQDIRYGYLVMACMRMV